MKYLSAIMLFFFAAFVITSCQKELSFEGGVSRGSIKKDAAGDCLPISVAGSYKTDTLLNATNFVDIQVDIAQTGTYNIKTDTLNGYSFSASGVVAVEGLNTIRLLGSGRPLMADLNIFTVKFDTSICQFDVIVAGAGGGGGTTAAVFTLNGSPTSCTGATQTNNFYETIPTGPSNYVDVNVNVTTAGSYSITTTANGVTLAASGNLSVGTSQPIRLLATGTPTAAGAINYALTTTTPASNCGFVLTVQAAPTPASFTFDCTTPTFFGNYQAGTAMNAGDSVHISVTSIAGGSYSITSSTTAANNGVTFTGNGVLPASPNPQIVTLIATGLPAAAGPFTYTITGTGSTGTCSITQTYTAPTSNGTLKFDIGTVTKTFNFFNGADTSIQNVPMFGNLFTLGLGGEAAASSLETFDITLVKSAPYFTNGSSYNVNQFAQSIILSATYTDAAGLDYDVSSDPTTTQTPAFSVTITSISATRVVGTFNGPLKTSTGTTITATNGSFDLPLQ